MPIMDDSGFDSEDKQSNLFEEIPIESVFGDGANKLDILKGVKEPVNELDVVFKGSKVPHTASVTNNKFLQTPQTSTETEPTDTSGIRAQAPSTCRILQRKLELKVERAKRNYTQYQEEKAKKLQSATLIPLERLSIPGEVPVKPLVDYKSATSEDEEEEVAFFPIRSKSSKKQKRIELTDTFSIREMPMDSDQESDRSGSPSLELLLPNTKTSFWDAVKDFLWCSCWR